MNRKLMMSDLFTQFKKKYYYDHLVLVTARLMLEMYKIIVFHFFCVCLQLVLFLQALH